MMLVDGHRFAIATSGDAPPTVRQRRLHLESQRSHDRHGCLRPGRGRPIASSHVRMRPHRRAVCAQEKPDLTCECTLIAVLSVRKTSPSERSDGVALAPPPGQIRQPTSGAPSGGCEATVLPTTIQRALWSGRGVKLRIRCGTCSLVYGRGGYAAVADGDGGGCGAKSPSLRLEAIADAIRLGRCAGGGFGALNGQAAPEPPNAARDFCDRRGDSKERL